MNYYYPPFTNDTNLCTIIDNDTDIQRNNCDNIGIYIEVKTKTFSNSYSASPNGYIKDLYVNNTAIYTPTISYKK